MPTYRSPRYLRQAIEDVTRQTILGWRLTISDNGGGNAEEIVRPYLDDPRISYSRNPTDLGITGNHSKLIRESTAEFVAIHHDDDRWEPEFLERRVTFMERHRECGFVFSPWIVIDEAGDEIRRTSAISGERGLHTARVRPHDAPRHECTAERPHASRPTHRLPGSRSLFRSTLHGHGSRDVAPSRTPLSGRLSTRMGHAIPLPPEPDDSLDYVGGAVARIPGARRGPAGGTTSRGAVHATREARAASERLPQHRPGPTPRRRETPCGERGWDRRSHYPLAALDRARSRSFSRPCSARGAGDWYSGYVIRRIGVGVRLPFHARH